MAGPGWMPLREAWQASLYGPGGFYRHERPVDHFRTSTHVSPVFAAAVAELASRHGLTSVWDVGAGEGELLRHIHASAPELALTGVDLRHRPAALPSEIGWRYELPDEYDGLVLAIELLDNVPCDVVELDASGRWRIVEIHAGSGRHRLADEADDEQLRWLERWWQVVEPGQRAEVGVARDSWWAGLQAASGTGLCVAVDYGHVSGDRPFGGTLSSYRHGIQTEVTFDAGHDITAGVAFDALAAVTGGELRRQRDLLRDLGITGERPALARATTDPAGYLRALTRATEAAELTEPGGLGDHYWLLSPNPGHA